MRARELAWCWSRKVVLADRHPDRVTSLVLLDGGMPLLPPPGVEADQLSQAILGPAAQRLDLTFADHAAYRDFWRDHPALAEWTELTTAYVDYDLVPGPDGLRPATKVEALQEDIRELVDGDSLLRDWRICATLSSGSWHRVD